MQYNNNMFQRLPQARQQQLDARALAAVKRNARLRAATIKTFLRDYVHNEGVGLTLAGFMNAAKQRFEQRGPPAEEIAATLSDSDIIYLYTYYMDMVTRNPAGNAINAYGAGFLAMTALRNDGLALDHRDNVSASKLGATATLMLYQLAITVYGFDELTARQLLTRDSFYIYHQRLGRARMLDGQLTSPFWSDIVTLTNNNLFGWTNVIGNYNRPAQNRIPTTEQLQAWWRNCINTGNGRDPNFYLNLVGALNRVMATWKVVCFLGYLKCEHIFSDEQANEAYSALVREFNARPEHYQGSDMRKLTEYATYFGIQDDNSRRATQAITRESFFGAGAVGNLFDPKDGARPKTSMKDRLRMMRGGH